MRRRDLKKYLAGIINDPMVKILVKNSNLTKTQLETFLIDVLTEKISGKRIRYEDKAKLRLLRHGVSRGAFNRTLRQARKNIINSIYTVILLGYLGIFEDPRLEPYLEIANKIHNYIDAYTTIREREENKDEYFRALSIIQRELETWLNHLVDPKTLSGKRDIT